MYVCMYVCVYMYVSICMYVCVCMYVRMYVCICVCVCVCVYFHKKLLALNRHIKPSQSITGESHHHHHHHLSFLFSPSSYYYYYYYYYYYSISVQNVINVFYLTRLYTLTYSDCLHKCSVQLNVVRDEQTSVRYTHSWQAWTIDSYFICSLKKNPLKHYYIFINIILLDLVLITIIIIIIIVRKVIQHNK